MTQSLPLDQSQRGPLNRKQRRQAQKRAKQRRQGAAAPAGRPRGAADAKIDQAAPHHQAGDFGPAERLYREALAAEPDHATAAFRLGSLLAQTRRHDEARPLLEQARRHSPDNVHIHNNLGVVYRGLGLTAEAGDSLRRAYEIGSDAETAKNYGSWCFQQGRFAEAAEALARGLASAPEDARRCHELAVALSNLERFEEARGRFEQALALDPGNAEMSIQLGVAQAATGQWAEAFPNLAAGIAGGFDKPEFQIFFARAATESPLEDYSETDERAFITCFESEVADLGKLALQAGRLIGLKYMKTSRVEESPAGAGPTKMHLDGILGDRLLILLLQKTVSKQIGLENLLCPLRQVLLRKARGLSEIGVEPLRFMVSFAMQCHHNSYVYAVGADELREAEELAQALDSRLGRGDAPDRGMEIALALSAMYRPLHDLAHFEALLSVPVEAWSEELRPLIELSLLNPAEEQRLKQTIGAFGSIEDATSRAVRSQYEENPYPRWSTMPMQRAFSFEGYLKLSFPWHEPTPLPEPRILIAGCGTGRHPIGVARELPKARVLAIDLSLASLAYAKRMAGRYDVRNLDFRHGDLLEAGALGETFDVIESVGVLHHLREPEAGLEALLGVLKPGGYFKIGLYSATARRWITAARARVRELGLEPTPEGIRAFRQLVIGGQEPELERYVGMSDFFDLDSFRDLVFHVQEHCFTVPQLKDLLERHGLRFLGLPETSGKQRELYRALYPEDSEMRDLDRWHEVETANPDCFISMYDLWCQKPS